jgi:cell division inhibitor SepF
MLYLGLGPDEEYDEHFQPPAEEASPARSAPRPERSAPAQQRSTQTRSSSVRTNSDRRSVSDVPEPAAKATSDSGVVRVIPADKPVVRAVPAPKKANPEIVAPETFNDAQQVGDVFKGEQPVIINLQGADKDLSRRLIDFASGLCYALGGKMEKVANHVYLLTPEAVEVTAEDRKRFSEGELSS